MAEYVMSPRGRTIALTMTPDARFQGDVWPREVFVVQIKP